MCSPLRFSVLSLIPWLLAQIMESIVVPHMDDLSFFNSRPFFSRGGIWGDALRKEHNLHTPAGTSGDESTTIGTGDTSDVEEVASEPVPSAVGQQGVESTTSAKEASAITARARTKRRTSSEGERGRPAEVAAPIKSNSSTSSLSSFSLSSWRESRASTATASTSPTNGAGAGDKRRSWFGAGRLPSQGSSTPPTNASQPSLGRTNTDDSASSIDSTSTKTSVEDSASRLRDILSKRAQSRERERETRVADSIKEADQLEEDEEQGASSTPKLSGLSLTAPKSSSTPSSTSTSSSLLGDLLEPPSSTRLATSEAAAVSKTPLTESPMASVEALIEPSTQPLPTLPTSQSHPSLSSVEPSPSPPGSTSTVAPPPIPSRPSFTKTLPSTPPPPPRRAPTHQSTQSADSAAAATSASSLLSSWRTKAADKQALAAGVAQGKEMMKRWGATWNAKRAGVEEEEEGEQQEDVGAQQDGGRSLSRERRRGEGSPSRGGEGGSESYRDYRAGKKGAKEEEEATSAAPISIAAQEPSARRARESSAASPPRSTNTRTHRSTLSSSPSSAGHFTPAAPSPTTKLSTAPTFAAGSPVIKPVSTTPARAYKPATMMAIPGIRDESRRNAVASDHVSAEEVKGKVEGSDSAGVGGKKEVEVKRAVPAVPEPASTVAVGKEEEVASAPASSSSSAVVSPASDRAASIIAAAPLPPPPPPRPAPAVKVELPTPLPAMPAVATRPVPPPPPPRTEHATIVDPAPSSAAPLVSTVGAEASAEAPLPAQVTTTSGESHGSALHVSSSGARVGVEEDDELADEAGWGVEVDEDEGGEVESGSARQ